MNARIQGHKILDIDATFARDFGPKFIKSGNIIAEMNIIMTGPNLNTRFLSLSRFINSHHPPNITSNIALMIVNFSILN